MFRVHYIFYFLFNLFITVNNHHNSNNKRKTSILIKFQSWKKFLNLKIINKKSKTKKSNNKLVFFIKLSIYE